MNLNTVTAPAPSYPRRPRIAGVAQRAFAWLAGRHMGCSPSRKPETDTLDRFSAHPRLAGRWRALAPPGLDHQARTCRPIAELYRFEAAAGNGSPLH